MLFSLHLHLEAEVLKSTTLWYVRAMLKFIFQEN